MSKIFELYGYRLDCWNAEASANREKAWCPFMDAECDGAGNSYNFLRGCAELYYLLNSGTPCHFCGNPVEVDETMRQNVKKVVGHYSDIDNLPVL